jgi:hypothetical protein
MRIKIKKSNVILTIVLAFQLISSTIFAQVPQKMSYQAVIRDASKALVTNKTIGMRVRIAQGTQTGTIVYTETFSPTSNVNGLVSLEIGGAAGFSAINWANGPYFILTDADLTGGSSYTISGYSQLVSVPYALYAKTAESLVGGTTIPSGTTLPTPVSVTGSFYFKTDENILYVSNGTAWLPLSTHGSTPSGTTFPTPTNPGDVFFNTANKNFYYWDGTSWKLVSNIPNGTTLPAASASVVGDPFFKTDTNILYVFNGTSWNPINGLSSTLAEGSLFVGNASNVATPTTKANIPISGFGAAAADVSLGSKNITNLATPLIATDAANKQYVDSKVSTNLSGPTMPAVGPAGNTFFNTTDKVFYISDGTKWLPVATDGSTPSGPTFPLLPSPGDVFYNTATSSYYYYDGTSWKLTSSIPSGTTLPLTGTTGDPFFMTDTNTLYIYSNGAWTVAGLSNILTNGSFFVGNASNIATPTTKATIPLSGFGAPTTSVSMGSQKLTNVATPTADPDAANKAYVDAKYAATPSGPTLPAVPGAAGNTFFNTTDNVLYISDGTKWLPVATDGSTPNGPTNPVTATIGDVFYNSALNAFYYYDGTNWKIISGVPLGPTNPVTGLPGETFYNTTNNTLYVNNGTTWNSTKVQADWAQNTLTADDYIKNKPTRLGQFINDVNYLTTLGLPAAETDPIWSAASGNYYTKINMQTSGGAQLHFNNLINRPTTLLGYGITDGGTVTSVSIITANGISGTVATPTTTPAISLTLGNITPTSVTSSGTVTSSNISGTNTGDQNASQVSVTPTGNISSTNVQNALVELQGDINTITSTSHVAVTLGTTTNGLSLTGQQLSLGAATATNPGALSAADWNTFNNKESSLTAGTAAQYYRGDKTWQTLDKTAVGLANVDNTTDLNKPISTATQGALDLKENIGNKSTNVALGTSDILYPTQNAVKSYVDTQITNATPDATTLVKGKVQLAGDLGGTAALPSVLKINGATLGTTTATNANILIANGTTWESQPMSGDVTMTNAGVTTIGAAKVTDSKLDKANIPISGFANAAANVSMGNGTTNYKITNLLAPTDPTDAVNKKYVDEAVNVPGNLYQGTITANLTAFGALDGTTISNASNLKGTSIPTAAASKICTLDKTSSTWTWVAFPKAWGAQSFFFRYNDLVYSVFEGFEKRVVTIGTVDYQVWVFKTTPNVDVDLIVNN